MTIHLHKHDLPNGIDFGRAVAIDTETQGLSLVRDKLCLVQLSAGDGDAHIVQMDRDKYDAPNLKALMLNEDVTKLFHFARFDVAIMQRDLGVDTMGIFCTKIASGLVRTYTDRHGLKDLTRELLGVDLSKQQQSSDWAADELTQAQMNYAASDVLYLHQLRTILTARLVREDRLEVAQSCFDFLNTRCRLDRMGWDEVDIFSHRLRRAD
ncbi:3'-5' exonuclease [Algimonas ampicilliniresistens]|jgi:ribonuclease D|uniref:3'-5' exonuclease n=1 Tax=Algimonas ampicilliniresistens TaxID=1298735 RepID=A0ABQ5VC61_9PROT|nr:ribonuclease D [Algimonas ampicilliniresistens]GLQ24186.1 3'-5' exonuclease [Algimonas ampicilliniresistens]